MTAKKAAWTAFLVAAALILVFYFLQYPRTVQTSDTGAPAQTSETAEAPRPQAAQSPETLQSESDSPAGVDRGNGFAQPSPDAPQAPELATPMQYERQEITAPPIPAPDTQDPEAVASAFLTVYNSRAGETDKSWQDTAQPWLTPDLAQQLPLVTNGALTGKTPTAVGEIEIGENVEDWGTDTPLRWSHHVQVTVNTQDQGSYVLEYRIRSQLTDQGWLINAAPLDSWQRVEK